MSNELASDNTDWFPPIREALLNKWLKETLLPNTDQQLACALIEKVSLDNGHLSLSCSISEEASQIEQLLKVTCFDDKPILFFRLMLFLLDEFTARLEDSYELIARNRNARVKQPKLISVWTNRYAKHRTAILIQHHAEHLFTDWPGHVNQISQLSAAHSICQIDFKWLEEFSNCKTNDANLNKANEGARFIILIPPLMEFLHAAIIYYKGFIKFAEQRPDKLKRFQSPAHLI